MKTRIAALTLALLGFPLVAVAQDPSDLVKQGQKLESEGKHKEALALYRQTLEKDPSQFQAHLAIGRVLDLEGEYAEARRHIQRGIELAPENGTNGALSTMAVSYAFEGNAGAAAKYYQQVFDRQVKAGALDSAGGIANALGRVYLETGDSSSAEKWYRTGYETARKAPTITPEQADLTEMRWLHAQGRIAARRQRFEQAHQYIAEVRAIVERGRLDEDQRLNYPHLVGYVAFYEGKHDEAIAALSKADQEDPFILGLLAQSYDKKGDGAKARELYAKILTAPGHSLQVAFSRPVAQRRLAGQ
jgi:tetratricopeptide (TPR) repeat protein